MKRVAFTKNTIHEYRSGSKWRMDPQGYCIIKVFYKQQEIGLRHFPAQGKEADLELVGDDGYEIVQYLVENGYVTSLQHAAYLGNELQKAQTAMRNNLHYNQDERLDFSKETTTDPSENTGN